MKSDKSGNTLAINIPADGLFLAIQHNLNGDLSKSNCEKVINRYIGKFLDAEPDIILLNVCYRRCLTPSEVFDSYLYNVETDDKGYAIKNNSGKSVKSFSSTTENVSKYFMSFILCARELLINGIDAYEIAIKRIRKTKCKVFLSVRMNDTHYFYDPAINSAFAVKDGCAHTVDKDGGNLDFSQEAVRNHYYAYIEELLGRYHVDGIETDWLRDPSVLSNEKRGDLSILRDYMKSIRDLLDRYNANASLAARILATEKDNLYNGIDACGWIADGSVNIITIENFYIPTNFELPVREWKKSIENRDPNGNSYLLLCGSDWAVSCVYRYNIAMTPALVRGFSDTCYQSGADGVYLFNYFEENDTSSFEFVSDDDCGGFIRNCFSERLKAAKNFNALPRRYVHIGNTNQRYPIVLFRNDGYELFKTIKSRFKKCKVVIGVDSDVKLSVYANDCFLGKLNKEVLCKGFEYIPETAIGKDNHFIYALTQAAPVVFSVYLPNDVFASGNFCLKIQNDTCNEIKILWIETVCE